jgi:hypothetical protein
MERVRKLVLEMFAVCRRCSAISGSEDLKADVALEKKVFETYGHTAHQYKKQAAYEATTLSRWPALDAVGVEREWDHIWKTVYDLGDKLQWAHLKHLRDGMQSFRWFYAASGKKKFAHIMETEQFKMYIEFLFKIPDASLTMGAYLVKRRFPLALQLFSAQVLPPFISMYEAYFKLRVDATRVLLETHPSPQLLEHRLGTYYFFGRGCIQSYETAQYHFAKSNQPHLAQICEPRAGPLYGEAYNVVLRILIDHATRPMLNDATTVGNLRLVCREWNRIILQFGSFWARHTRVDLSGVPYNDRSSRIFVQKAADELSAYTKYVAATKKTIKKREREVETHRVRVKQRENELESARRELKKTEDALASDLDGIQDGEARVSIIKRLQKRYRQ